MKAVIVSMLLAIGLVACGKSSPVAPSVSVAQSIEQAQLATIIWGTNVGGGGECIASVSIDTGSNGNPSPAGTDVTGKVTVCQIKSSPQSFNVTYGSVVSGPATVTVPGFSSNVTFTVHTSGSGTDATVTLNSGSTLTSHKSSNTIIWGT